jgi:hypothetical protein
MPRDLAYPSVLAKLEKGGSPQLQSQNQCGETGSQRGLDNYLGYVAYPELCFSL